MSSPLEDFYDGNEEDEQMGSSQSSLDKITPGPPISQQTSELFQIAQEQDQQIKDDEEEERRGDALSNTIDTNVNYTDLAQSEDNGSINAIHRSLSPVSPLPVRVAEPSNIPLLVDVNMNPTHQQIQDINHDSAPTDLTGIYIPSERAQIDDNATTSSTHYADQTSSHLNPENTTDRDDVSNSDDALQQQLYASLEEQQESPSHDVPDHLSSTTLENPSLPPPTSDMMDHEVMDTHEPVEEPESKSASLASSNDGVDHSNFLQNAGESDKMDESGAHVPSSTENNANVDGDISSPNKVIQDIKVKIVNLPANPIKKLRLSPVSQVSPSVPAFFQPTSLSHPSSLPPPPHLVSRSVVQNGALTSPTSLQHPPAQLRHPLPEAPPLPVSDENEEPRPFTVQEEKEYEAFQAIERDYVSKGQWDRFPNGSRLFIGNLLTEKITKRDLFRIFSKHGRLAQVSIKQAYGFIQFFDNQACTSALTHEQNTSIRGRKMHLEVSKPQRNTRTTTDTARPTTRRSRSPDHQQPISPRARQGSFRGSHYSPNSPGNDPRDSRDNRGRDEYRSSTRRASSPRYGREDYHRRDYYERSRSPVKRYRSPTPPRKTSRIEDDLPLEPRAPHQVPEVQMIIYAELDRNFIRYIEQGFKDQGIKIEVLFLAAARLPLQAVIKRQILEGVLAVVILDEKSQMENKMNMQIFDRRGGHDNVRFDEYQNIDPRVGPELVLRARQTHGLPAAIPSYGVIPYGLPQQPQAPPIQPQMNIAAALAGISGNPNLASLIGSLDPVTLQNLLTSLQGQPAPSPTTNVPPTLNGYPTSQIQPDLASLFGGGTQQQYAQQLYGQNTPDLSALFAGQQQQLQQNQQVRNLMEQFAQQQQWSNGR